MGALLVNLGRESGSHDAPLLFSVSHTGQASPAGIATTLRDPPHGRGYGPSHLAGSRVLASPAAAAFQAVHAAATGAVGRAAVVSVGIEWALAACTTHLPD